MLLVAAVTVVILAYCLILHYKKHFRFQLSRTKPSSSSRRLTIEASAVDINSGGGRDRVSSINSDELFGHEPTYRCMFTSADTEDFDFFPVSFFFYLTFIILVCIILIAKCFIFDLYYDDDIGEYFIKSFDEHFNSLKSHDQESLFNNHGVGIIKILDWILVYSIMILSIWESLFLFYRYYTTLVSTNKYYHPSSYSVFKRFSIYMIIFIFSFISYIHFTYYMFPVVVALYSVFNVYCTMKFSSLLIQRYRLFITMAQSQRTKDSDKDILRSVYFMRKTSLFCTMVQSFSLTLFVISYNVDIMYYIPILWGISCFMFTLNFVRNRQSIKQCVFDIFWRCKYSKCCTYFEQNCIQKIKESRRKKILNTIRETLTVHNENDINSDYMHESQIELTSNLPHHNTKAKPSPNSTGSVSGVKGLKVTIKSSKSGDHILASSHSIPNTPNSPETPEFNGDVNDFIIHNGLTSPSVPVELARASIIQLPPKNPITRNAQSAYQEEEKRNKKVIDFASNRNRIKKRHKNKAFAILGLIQQCDISSSMSNPSPIVGQHKRAITQNVDTTEKKVKFLDEKEGDKGGDNLHLNLNSSSVPNMTMNATKTNLKQKKLQQSAVSAIKEEDEEKEKEKEDKEKEEDIEQTVVINLDHVIDKVSTPATPLIMDHTAYSMPTPMNNDKIDPKTPMAINEQDCDDFIYLDNDLKVEENVLNDINNNNNNNNTATNDINIIYNDEKEKEQINNNQYNVNVPKITVTQHAKLNDIHLENHYRSKSKSRRSPRTPLVDEASIDLENVVNSLQILVDFGFSSKLSVNNIKQIKSYRDAQLEKLQDIEEENDDQQQQYDINDNKIKISSHHYRS